MLKAMLVDDEYFALKGLEIELLELGGVEIVGAYEDEIEALKMVPKLKPDIVFLDIDMPRLSGMEVFYEIKKFNPKTHVIFVTAYDRYAVKAFELNATDYIVKPVRRERLKKSLERLNIVVDKNKPATNKKVSISCFGPFSMKVDGRTINIKWRTKKIEELIAYLACFRGDFISKEKIASELWPDMDITKSKSNLYLAYYYLNKQSEQVGLAFPVESVKGKMRLNLELADVDIERFLREANEIEEISSDNIEKAHKIMSLYSAPLLDGHYYEWGSKIEHYLDRVYNQLNSKISKYI